MQANEKFEEENSYDSDSTIIEMDINYERITSNLCVPESNKLDILDDGQTCNFTKSKLDAEIKLLTNCSPKELQNSSRSATNSIKAVSSGFLFKHNAQDPELDSILKKYSSCATVSTSATTSMINSKPTFSISEEPIELSSDDELSPKVDEKKREQLSSDDNLPQFHVKNVLSPSVPKTNSPNNEDLFKKYTVTVAKDKTEKFAMETEPEPCGSYSSPKKRRKIDSDKEQRKIERALQQAKKREETERAKKLKQAIAAANKNMKPEECIKFVNVQLDTEIINEKYGGEILNSLQAAEVTYHLQSQLVPYAVTWNRKVQEPSINDNGEVIETSETHETDEVLLIMNSEKIIELVHNKSLVEHLTSIKSVFFGKKLSLAIYGLGNYFRYQKSQKQKEVRSDVAVTSQKSNSKSDKIFKDTPKITKKEFELASTKLQVLCSCCYRLVDTPQDIGAMIAQYTKAIAQAPFKFEKQKKIEQAEWYVGGDNKDCVSVDKNGNGLQRLWQQQLTTFPLARLEHAEAITAKYSTPSCLIKEFEKQFPDEGEILLRDIPVRRAAGPLTSVRKIGPELGKKIYTFFVSRDEDLLL